VPTYRNAELLIHENEFSFWMGSGRVDESSKIKQSRERNQKNLLPYLGQIRRMKDADIAFGCCPLLAPGHTPGHTCWRIDAGRDTLLAWGDVVHFYAIQIGRPDVAVTYDMDADLARASRLKMLQMAVADKLTVAGTHIDAPGVGRIVLADETYSFVPYGNAC
jgi:glyoxylase-like metal-dependent hydrolase (beta-lactamase superfamily II)